MTASTSLIELSQSLLSGPNPVLLPVPEYFPNGLDNAGCWPTCVRMVVSTKPGLQVPSVEELDRIQGREPNKIVWAWALSNYMACKNEFEVARHIGKFDARRFVEIGETYLFEHYIEADARSQIEHCNIPAVREHVRASLENPNLEIVKRISTVSDIRDRLTEGWYVVPCVDYSDLHGDAKDTGPGHFVVAFGYDDNHLLIHDPGKHNPKSPGRETCIIPWDRFKSAWAPGNENDRSMTCFRPTGSLQGAPPAHAA